MTQFGNDRETSRRTGHDDGYETSTTADRDVTARMTGTHGRTDDHDRTVTTGRPDDLPATPGRSHDERTVTAGRSYDDRTVTAGRHDDGPVTAGRSHDERVVRPTGDDHRLHGLKTSAAAVFSLVFGLAALFCALTAILSPAAVVFGLIGLVLGIVGLTMSRRRGVTGHGVAVGGLVTSVLGLLLGAAVIVGASVVVNDEARLDQLQEWIDDRRDDVPTTGEIREQLPE